MLVRIVAGIAAIVDSVLSHFVTDLTLTDPKGNEFAGSLSSILHYGAALFAKLLMVFNNITS